MRSTTTHPYTQIQSDNTYDETMEQLYHITTFTENRHTTLHPTKHMIIGQRQQMINGMATD